MIDPVQTLFVGAWLLLGVGFYGLMIARNLIKLVIAIQIMVKAAMIVLVIAGRASGQLAVGQSLAVTVIAADTMVAVIGLALVVKINGRIGSLQVDEIITGDGEP